MRFVPLLVGLVAACSGEGASPEPNSNGSTGSNGSASEMVPVSLSGKVSNPLSAEQAGRLIVGVMPAANVTGTIHCSAFLIRFDKANARLPALYTLEGSVRSGTYLVVALLVGSGNRAMIGPYGVMVDTTGVHYNAPTPLTELDLSMQGTTAYDCN